ncbi:hypothetical protein [Psychroserpens sp. NJDZ02]|uniref:hypothetical protein n=1 Tax=Psychroserpens sp. NJDZ02 TaxID=2570561 RepID=UPI0010A8D31A|nr:hypothetical protein [Psychroserpens sp. NJDZ02]QCE42433.1 hypothetical protein E9099_13830 [Psychroserpens sp. NJDZ02]
MQHFTTKFLNPFSEQEVTNTNLSPKEVLLKFRETEWYEYIKKSFKAATDSSSKPVLNDFWYFTINYVSNKQNFNLLIVPTFASSNNFTERDITFSVEYTRPKQIMTSKFNQFFGGAKQKWVDHNTHIKNLKIPETQNLIEAFVNDNHSLLAHNSKKEKQILY